MKRILFFLFLLLSYPILSVDFDDIDESKTRVYGSEKEAKYPLSLFFTEIESWDGHYSWHFFWFTAYKSYPQYSHGRLFPLISTSSSKIDARKESRYLNYQYSREKDNSEYHTFFPLVFYGNEAGKQAKNYLAVFPLLYKSQTTREKYTENFFISTVLPYYFSETEDTEYRNFLLLFDWERNKKKDKLEKASFMPLVYYKPDSYFYFLPLYYNEKTDTSKFFLFIPFYYHKSYPGYKENLVFPLYYTLNDTDGTSRFNFLGFYNQKKDKSDTVLSKTVFPFYFYDRESESKESTLLLPLYYSKTDSKNAASYKNVLGFYEHDYKGDTLKYRNIYPLYFYERENEFTEKSLFFPFWSTETNSKTNSSDISYVGLYNHKYQEGKLKSRRFFPFYFYNKEGDSIDSTLLLPFFYSKSDTKNDTSHKNILGLYEHDYKGDTLKSRNIYPLYYYEKENENSDTSLFVPFWYKETNTKTDSSKRNYLGLYNHEYKDGFLKSRWFVPFYFRNVQNEFAESTLILPITYSKSDSKEQTSYRNILGFYDQGYKNNELTERMVFPFYFYKKDEYKYILPFYFKTGPDKDEEAGKRYGPLYYKSWTEEESTTYIVNYYNYENKKKDTNLTVGFPLYYKWKNSAWKGDTLLPLWWNSESANKDKFNVNLLGLATSSKTGVFQPDVSIGLREGKAYVDVDYSWLYYMFRLSVRRSDFNFFAKKESADPNVPSETPKLTKKRDFTREESFNFYGWNALFQLIAYEKGDTKQHFRLFPLAWFTWDNNSNDKVYVLPPLLPLFVHYTSQDLKYTVFIPFFGFQKTPEAERNAYLLLLYFNETVKENNTKEHTILWPLINIHNSDIQSGSRFLPFYWNKKTFANNIKTNTFITPLSYYRNFKRENLELSRFYTPLSYYFYRKTPVEEYTNHFSILHWKNETKRGQSFDEKFLIPFYFGYDSYEEKDRRTETIRYYYPFFYKSNYPEYSRWNVLVFIDSKQSESENKFLVFPAYSHKITKDTVNRNSFFIFNYFNSSADKNKTTEWDIYPIAKFSSSETDSSAKRNKNYFFPFFYQTSSRYASLPKDSSQKVETKDFNFHTLLGSYMTDTNQGKSNTTWNFYYLFRFNTSEYDKSSNETTNYMIPLFYYNSFNGGKSETAKTEMKDTRFYNLLFLYNSEKSDTIDNTSFYSLLYSRSVSIANKDEATKKSFYLATPILLYHEDAKDYDYYRFLLFFTYKSEPNNTESNIPLLYANQSAKSDKSKTSLFYIFPSYYKNYKDEKQEELTLANPFFYYNNSASKDKNAVNSKTTISWLYNNWDYKYPNEKENESYTFYPIPLLYRSNTQNETRTNFLILSDWKYENDKLTRLMVFPFWYSKENNADATTYVHLLPLFYYSKSNSGDKYAVNSKYLFTWFYNNWEYKYPNEKENESYTFYPIPLLYRSVTQNETRTNFLLLSDWKYENNKLKRLMVFPLWYYEDSLFLSLLYNNWEYKNPDGKVNESYSFYPIPFLYRSVTPGETRTNLLLFTDWKYENNNLTRLMVVPFWYSKENSKDATTYFHIAPFHFSGWDAKEYKSYTAFLYIEKSENYSQQNFLFYLFDHTYYKTEANRKVSLLFTGIQYESTPKSTSASALWGLLYGLESDESQFKTNLLWLGHKKEPTTWSNNILPLWYIDKKEQTTEIWLPPLLSYSEVSKDQTFQLGGLGALYYRNSIPADKEDTLLVLLGSIYYDNERKDRGYRGRGSLWGLLWKYETETENGYSKFSILEFVFSKKTMQGDTSYRILGVAF